MARLALGVLHFCGVKCLKLRICMFGYVVVDIVIRHSSNDFHVPFECHAAFILGDQSVMAFERIIEDVGTTW